MVFTHHDHVFALHNVLHSIASQRKIEAYLEVGVCAGESLHVLLSQQFPDRLTLCDTWGDQYGGQAFGDARHIEWMLNHFKYPNPTTYLNGNSHQMLKKVTQLFDLITVDGDHSPDGAREDLEDCWSLLMPNGLLVFDDIAHEAHPHLSMVFKDFIDDVNATVIHEDMTPLGVGVLCKTL